MQQPDTTYINDELPAPTHSSPVLSLAVASGKGGVGKTTVAINLSTALAKLKRGALLLDTDLGLANVDVMLGLSPAYNLSDVLAGRCQISESVIAGPEGLFVIPAATGKTHMAELLPAQHVGLVHAVSTLRLPITSLVVDNAAGIADSVLTFCQASHEVVLVVCDDPSSITDSYALIKVLSRERDVSRIQILVNMAESDIEGRKVYDKLVRVCDRFLNVSLHYMGSIPRDPFLQQAVKRQVPVVTQYPSSPSARAFMELAKRISHWAPPTTVSGRIEFFMERLIPVGFAA